MLRSAAAVAAGLAMTTSFGLTGAGMASAATPALHIKSNAIWTLEIFRGGCEQDTFDRSTHTFIADANNAAGTWQYGGSAILMIWTQGGNAGHNFGGRFVSTTTPVRFKGSWNGGTVAQKAKLVKGAVAFYQGIYCGP